MTTGTVQQAIDQYRAEGFSFIPIPPRSKVATIKWEVYQSRQPTEDEITHWKSNGTANIAIICGAVSGNLVVLDFDSEDKFNTFADYASARHGIEDIFKFSRIVKTANGYHLYLRTAQPVKSAKFPKMDVKGEGGYVIAPPSIHPTGAEYVCLNPEVPVRTVDSLQDVGIDINQKPEGEQETGNAGEIIPPGTQDAWLFSRACSYRVKGDDVDSIIEKLRIDIKRCPQEPGKRPYNDADFKRIAESACKYPPGSYGNTSIISNTLSLADNSLETGQKRDKSGTVSGQTLDNEGHQKLASSFDNILKEAGRMTKRDIAGTLSVQVTNDSFRRLVNRRLKDGQVRWYRGSSETLEWVNRDYKILTLADYQKQANLSITLPLGLNKYVNVPPGSVIGVAGCISAGKTAVLFEICELNVGTQDMPVYYWFNEMSEDRMLLRLEDYPSLLNELGSRFKAVKQTDFQFYDVIEPDAINVIDYLDLDGGEGDNQVFMIGALIKKLQQKLGKGIVIFALQKKEKSDMGYGGVYSAKLSNLYLSLDTVSQGDTKMMGKCKIVKAKDWGEVNPVGLYCNYYTGGRHGKIMSDNLWRRESK